jgi:hypothetical protein
VTRLHSPAMSMFPTCVFSSRLISDTPQVCPFLPFQTRSSLGNDKAATKTPNQK